MRPRILCISFSNIVEDSRVLRQLDVLSEFGDVTTLCYGTKPLAAASHLSIDIKLPSLPQSPAGVLRLALRRFKSVSLTAPAVVAARKLAEGKTFDLIVANEARALPLAYHLAESMPGYVPIWGDMHEWAPEERTHVLSWRLLVAPYMTWVCKEYLRRTDAVTTVNGSIAELYKSWFGIDVSVVRNASAYRNLSPSPMVPGLIRLAHSGAAVPGRNLEGMIKAVLQLDDQYTLDFYLVKARDGGKYWQHLRNLCAGTDRIRFHDAVASSEVPATLNQYDLGIYSLPPQTTNHQYMLPNKFFDFVQARLGLVFGPSPETSALIHEHSLGVVADGFGPAELANAIRSITAEKVTHFKTNANAAARDLSSEKDSETERRILRSLLKISD